ncbi:GtrA family protein [Streptomyces sp. A7024]|uniref:GtrA family protein n=1 Tax=Streptomyces coryli TaxID=1128680 RepID=A0A6G4U475_9ACTN|nr:GtrA family protein [Streptomyces coryli]
MTAFAALEEHEETEVQRTLKLRAVALPAAQVVQGAQGGRLRKDSQLTRLLVFGAIGASGFLPNLGALHLLVGAGMHYLPAEIVANQAGVLWNFVLTEFLLFRDRRGHRHWADRAGRFALLANADLLLRIPLIALLVSMFGLPVLPATAVALGLTFVLRYVATEALVYLPRRRARGRHRRG